MGISCFGFSTLQGQAGKGHLNPFESVKPAYELMDDIINLSSEPIYRKMIKNCSTSILLGAYSKLIQEGP